MAPTEQASRILQTDNKVGFHSVDNGTSLLDREVI